MTAEIFNLNRIRKARERSQKEKQADANRRRFGASKTERAETAAVERGRDRTLDGAALEPARLDESAEDLDPGAVS